MAIKKTSNTEARDLMATAIQRSKDDLRASLAIQVNLLHDYCDEFDAGAERKALPMSTSLRTLLHTSRTSHSLLHQLGLRDRRFYTVAPPDNPRNLLASCGLVGQEIWGNDSAEISFGFYPVFNSPFARSNRRLKFAEWWNNTVARNGERTMCRRDIVLAVANKDGGAHVDPTLEPLYEDFRSGEFLRWTSIDGDTRTPFVNPQLACLRAIADEVLRSLMVSSDSSFERPYRTPRDRAR